MIRKVALYLLGALALSFGSAALPGIGAVPAVAQSEDYMAPNSRIRRDRQFPTEPQTYYERRELTRVGRSRSRSMIGQFGRCMWNRSNEDSIAFLDMTDMGFVNFEQIGWTREQVSDYFPIDTCLDRVARNNRSGVRLNYTDAGIRQWLIEAAYNDLYPDGPTWLQPGYIIGDREYPVSAAYPQVHASLNFADCLVAANPVDADYFYRTGQDSEEESAAVQRLMPTISGCLPAGQTIDITPFTLRIWLGEGLWHAARNSAPAPVETGEGAE